MRTLPKNVTPYKKTPIFDEQTVPAGLLKSHSTKDGTWAKIEVAEGKLRYRILEPTIEEVVLNPTLSGVVEPTIAHEVAPLGKVKFFVEFYK